jgi:hypothetical protein
MEEATSKAAAMKRQMGTCKKKVGAGKGGKKK